MDSKRSMRLLTLISLKNEPLLEKWARFFRYAKADGIIQEKAATKKQITLVDFGCGQDILYYKYLSHTSPSLAKKLNYIGIDPLIDPKSARKLKAVTLINKRFEDIKFKEKADIISIFAVLEHVDDPAELLLTAAKHLKPDGVIVATTPSPLARYPLEFFSYVLGIIAKREIDEHKRYPNRKFLLGLNKQLKGLKIEHEYFEFGLNNYCVIGKNKPASLPQYSFSRDLSLLWSVLSRSLSNAN